MGLSGNHKIRWTISVTIAILIGILSIQKGMPWSGEAWGPLSRGEIVERAEEMINLTWSPNRGIYNYRSSVGYTVFNSYITYTGQAYSQSLPLW